jgi:hypothetical protein
MKIIYMLLMSVVYLTSFNNSYIHAQNSSLTLSPLEPSAFEGEYVYKKYDNGATIIVSIVNGKSKATVIKGRATAFRKKTKNLPLSEKRLQTQFMMLQFIMLPGRLNLATNARNWETMSLLMNLYRLTRAKGLFKYQADRVEH